MPKNIKNIKKISFYDLDGTLLNTSMSKEGKKEWEEKTGEDFSGRAWWSNKESLNPEIFDVEPFTKIKNKLENDYNNDNIYTVILSSRLEKFRNEIKTHLENNKINVDEISLKSPNSVKGKDRRILDFLNRFPNVEEIDVYDDRTNELKLLKSLKNDISDHIKVNIYAADEGKTKVYEKVNVIKSLINEEINNLTDNTDINSDEFKQWFGNSKVINSDGTPKIMLHRSDNPDITKFKIQNDKDYIRKHSKSTNGIYFHSSKTMIPYGKYEYKVYLKIEKPFKIDNAYFSKEINPYTGKKINIQSIGNEDLKWLKEQGYDGVIGTYPSFETVVFNPEQIRIIKPIKEEINDLSEKISFSDIKTDKDYITIGDESQKGKIISKNELPQNLYHVSPYKNKILKDGYLKVQKEGKGRGFGGGRIEGISCFTDLENAKTYYEGMLFAIALSKCKNEQSPNLVFYEIQKVINWWIERQEKRFGKDLSEIKKYFMDDYNKRRKHLSEPIIDTIESARKIFHITASRIDRRLDDPIIIGGIERLSQIKLTELVIFIIEKNNIPDDVPVISGTDTGEIRILADELLVSKYL